MHDPLAGKEMEERFTKPADAVRYIQELESLELSTISDSQLEKLIDDYFPIFPFTSVRIAAGEEVFRARVNINKEPFTKVKDIYVPEPNLITKYGRANKPNEQIFYCASNFHLAAFEVIQNLKYSLWPEKEVAFLTIGVWKVKEELHVTNIVHSQKLHDLRKDIFEAYKSGQDILNMGFIKEDTITAHNLLCQFFADQFTKDNIKNHHDYKISALYARRLKLSNEIIASQYSSDKFDGINYPSVAMKFRGDNQAFFIESAERKLELVNALQVLCGNIKFETGEFLPGIIHEAETIEDGIITWKKEIYRPKQNHV